MDLVVLRHRAVCSVCASKLPPRTEAWWDEEDGVAVCVSCQRLQGRQAAAAPAAAPGSRWASAPRPPAVGSPEVDGAADPRSAGPGAPPAVDPRVVARMRSAVGADPAAPAVPAPAPSPARDTGAARSAPAPAAPVEVRPVPAPIGSLPAPPADAASADAPPAPPVDLAPAVPPSVDSRITELLEGARERGLLSLHWRLVGGRVGVVDHLVVAPNGIWVVATAPEPIGRVERRDLGDWFTPDPRLYVAGVDASPLLEQAVASFRAVDEAMAGGPLANVARFGVLCFVDAAPAWFAQPFSLADITVTWRRHLLEPMLGATVYGPPTRLELARFLADRFPPAD